MDDSERVTRNSAVKSILKEITPTLNGYNYTRCRYYCNALLAMRIRLKSLEYLKT